MKSIELNDQP